MVATRGVVLRVMELCICVATPWVGVVCQILHSGRGRWCCCLRFCCVSPACGFMKHGLLVGVLVPVTFAHHGASRSGLSTQ